MQNQATSGSSSIIAAALTGAGKGSDAFAGSACLVGKSTGGADASSCPAGGAPEAAADEDVSGGATASVTE